MKRLFVILVMLTGAVAANAQQTNFTLSAKPATIKHFTCSCNTKTNYTASLLKSYANADRFQKMTKLTADTIDYKPFTVKIRENIPVSDVTKYLNTTAAVNIDRMPIAKPTNTDPHMPIVKTDRTTYTMPIVGNGKAKAYLNYKTKGDADSVVIVK